MLCLVLVKENWGKIFFSKVFFFVCKVVKEYYNVFILVVVILL